MILNLFSPTVNDLIKFRVIFPPFPKVVKSNMTEKEETKKVGSFREEDTPEQKISKHQKVF